MRKANLDVLKKIVSPTPENVPSVSDLFGQQQVTTNREFLAETTSMPNQDRWSRWNAEVASDWEFTPDNNDEYWNTFRKLWPGTEEEGEGFIKQEVFSSFKDKAHEEQEQIFRDKLRTWPKSLYPSLEEHFISLKGLNDTKHLEKSIVFSRLELAKALENTELNLDPQVPTEVHTNEWLKLYRGGHDKGIQANEEGRLTYPQNGKRELAFTLPDEEDMSAEEQLIYLKYLKPLVKAKMTSVIERTRKEQLERDKESVNLLALDITNPAILDEHRANIIIAKAKDSENPVEVTRNMMSKVIDSKIESGGIKSIDHLVSQYSKLWNNIRGNVQRRLGDDIV